MGRDPRADIGDDLLFRRRAPQDDECLRISPASSSATPITAASAIAGMLEQDALEMGGATW